MGYRNRRAGYSRGYGYTNVSSAWIPSWRALEHGGEDEGYYRKWCEACGKETEWDADACLGPVCYLPR